MAGKQAITSPQKPGANLIAHKKVNFIYFEAQKSSMSKIILGADHAGFKIKEEVKKYLDKLGMKYEDLSVTYSDGDDFPVHAQKVALRVVRDKALGILICGTGVGMSIAANKVKGIRAAAVEDEKSARLCRNDNDANILCLGARIIDEKVAEKCVKAFLSAEFLGGRHQRRVDLIKAME